MGAGNSVITTWRWKSKLVEKEHPPDADIYEKEQEPLDDEFANDFANDPANPILATGKPT